MALLNRPGRPGADWPDGVDAFQVLGLPHSPDLTDDDVRRAYLLRLRAVHPDNGGDGEAAAAVTAAYDALRSGVRRGELLALATVDRGGTDVGARRRRAPDRGRGPGRQRGVVGSRPGGVPDAARREELRARVAASRAAQGLPPFVTDEATLARIADLFVVMLGRGGDAAHRHGRSVGSAWPGWDHGANWDDAAGRPLKVWEPSSWRRERRRRLVRERELAEAARPAPVAVSGRWPRRVWLRVCHGRPMVLAARVVVAAAVPWVAQVSAGGDPAVPALAAGALTWLVLTGRLDLASGRTEPR